MSRFSPGYRSSQPEQYRRMETGLADAIAGSENLYDTRKRQDTREKQTDRRIDIEQQRADTDEGYLDQRRYRDYYETGGGPGRAPTGGTGSSDQREPQGQGRTLPDVRGMPTIQEGPGTPVPMPSPGLQGGVPPVPMPTIRGSGVPGDYNGLVDGRNISEHGEYWVDEVSPMEKQKRERTEYIARAIQEGSGWLGPGGAATREQDARATALGFPPGRDPRSEAMWNESIRGSRGGGGGAGSQVSATAQYNAIIAEAEAYALDRAIDLMDKGMSEADAAYLARLEASQMYRVPVGTTIRDVNDYVWNSGRGPRWERENADKVGLGTAGGGIRGRVQGDEEEEEPGTRQSPVYTWRRDRP